MRFADRTDAGRQLAALLRRLASEDVVVLGLPRGGVPVASEVAASLGAPLDVIVVRKLGVPVQPEYAFGAIGEDGVRVIDERVTAETHLSAADVAAVEAHELAVLDRRIRQLRGIRPPVPLAGRTVIIVDDGIATGSTARAACQVARARGAARVVLAAPVGPPSAVAELGREADEVICAFTPDAFFAIGQWYDDFSQTSDDEVRALLDEAATAIAGSADPPADRQTGKPRMGQRTDRGAPAVQAEVIIDAGGVRLPGILSVPGQATGLVIFAHGSGSGRHSPRNQAVAAALNRAGHGTLLADLLTVDEEFDRERVFNIALLATRLTGITEWARREPATAALAIGYFGASTGAGAALQAAAGLRQRIAAVVSRGGRPDLAADHLAAVQAPTLLIVGGADDLVLDLNRQAQQRLTCENRLVVVPGATHLFEEPGALDQVADLAADWFGRHFG